VCVLIRYMRSSTKSYMSILASVHIYDYTGGIIYIISIWGYMSYAYVIIISCRICENVFTNMCILCSDVLCVSHLWRMYESIPYALTHSPAPSYSLTQYSTHSGSLLGYLGSSIPGTPVCTQVWGYVPSARGYALHTLGPRYGGMYTHNTRKQNNK